MRIIALLSWFDEDPLWLKRCIESLEKIPVDDLVALDGAYSLYPPGRRYSEAEQYRAVHEAARHLRSRYVSGWVGNTEIEKRNELFRVAETKAEPGDWYMVIDADEFVVEAPENLHDLLAGTPFDVGAVDLIEPGHPRGTIHFPTFPMFFRAIPGLRVTGEHFCYRTPDGRCLWGDATRQRLEPRLTTGLTVQHQNQFRDPERQRAAQAYYQARDEAGIEGLKAERYLTKDDCANV